MTGTEKNNGLCAATKANRKRLFFLSFILLNNLFYAQFANAVNPFTQSPAYPSVETYDKDFIFERSPQQLENLAPPNDNSFRCVQEAAFTLHPGAEYYYIHEDYDVVVTKTDTPGVGVVLFSLRETDQAKILPGNGATDLPIFLKSKIEVMCPEITTEIHRKEESGFTKYDALIFQY